MRQPGLLTSFLFVLLTAIPALGKEIAEVVYDKVHPSVVSLRSAEGSGTGIVIDRNGLILTNAHVIMSPLRFEATIDLRLNGKLESKTFRKVTVLGIHPKYDLAIVKIDPAEHRGVLTPATLSRDLPKPGKSLYAIGNPGGGDGLILTKTITSGMLSGVRQINDLTYLQVSAAINPGNSGGPLCDATGNVVGVVTFKFTEVESIAFAIPTKSFALSEFIPWQKKLADKDQVKELVTIAEKYMDKADDAYRRFGNQHEQTTFNRAIALRAYWLALMNSPGDSALFYNVGMVYSRLEALDIALAYLVRAVELEPWGDERANYFREIGFALVKLERFDEALVAYREGITKYPNTAGKTWEDLSITYINRSQWVDSAYAAKVAMHVGDSRADAMQNIHNQAVSKMSAAQKKQLETTLASMSTELKKSQALADKAKAAKKRYMNADFEALMKKLGTLENEEDASKQLAAARAATASSETPEATDTPDDTKKPQPKPVVPEKDPEVVWIEKKLDLADLYRSGKQKDKEIEVLQEIIERHPDHAMTAAVKKRLERLKG